MLKKEYKPRTKRISVRNPYYYNNYIHMKEIKHPISPSQSTYIQRFKDMLHTYYVKGNNSYTTLMGYKLGMRDCISLLDSILYTNYYTNEDKEQLNAIRSMYISPTNIK